MASFRRGSIWQAGSAGILVHTGQELRRYGPGLKLGQSISLGGPLALVRISPSGAYFAVGVIRERHTKQVHKALLEAENREPEEDVELKVYDENFRILASVVRSSREPWPVLSDTGEVRVFSLGKERWRIVENTWDRQRRALAQFSSSCVPRVTAVGQALLLAEGCDRLQAGKWFRMLNPDGKSILKGWSPSQETGVIAIASASGDAFAISTATAARTLNQVFRGTDLKSQGIGVYDSKNAGTGCLPSGFRRRCRRPELFAVSDR